MQPTYTDHFTVYTSNRWEDWSRPEIDQCFASMSPSEAALLKKGNSVWYDGEPYHPNGKVYGYTHVILTDVENGNFHHSGGFFGLSRLYKLVDPGRLSILLQQKKSCLFDILQKLCSI